MGSVPFYTILGRSCVIQAGESRPLQEVILPQAASSSWLEASPPWSPPQGFPPNVLAGHPWALIALAKAHQSPRLGPGWLRRLEGPRTGGQGLGKCGRQEGALWLCAICPFGWSLHLSSDPSPCPQLHQAHSGSSQAQLCRTGRVCPIDRTKRGQGGSSSYVIFG